MIRFTVTSSHTKLADIERDWEVIKSIATIIIDTCNDHMTNMAGDDQLEDEPVGEAGEEPSGLVSPKTRRMPLGGKMDHPSMVPGVVCMGTECFVLAVN